MLNFRKLKSDFSPSILKEGKSLYDKAMVRSVKILDLSEYSIRFDCQVMGSFDHCYQSELEIDAHESTIAGSDCDCSYKYDCQHLAAVLFYLESHYSELLVEYSHQSSWSQEEESCLSSSNLEKNPLLETIKEAEHHEHARQDKKLQKQLLEEYIQASAVLTRSPFFHKEEEIDQDKAELALIYHLPQGKSELSEIEIQLALRLPMRSKALSIPLIKPFLDAIRYQEPLYIGNKRYFFSFNSFDEASVSILKILMEAVRFSESKNEKQQKITYLEAQSFGEILAKAFAFAEHRLDFSSHLSDNHPPHLEPHILPCLYCDTIEEPLRVSFVKAKLRFELNYLEVHAPKILLKPQIVLPSAVVSLGEGALFECAAPSFIHHNIYYAFPSHIKRKHLKSLRSIQEMTLPEPLFGTFLENALTEMSRFAEVSNLEVMEQFTTLPFVESVKSECFIHYLNGELEASLYFIYGAAKIPAASSKLSIDHMATFITSEGILARNLIEEQKIIDLLFEDFLYDPSQGVFVTKNEKKIVEFMTELIPNHSSLVTFHCPENLLEQFVYDDSTFTLNLKESDRIDSYQVEIDVKGPLQNQKVDLLWDCLLAQRPFIELSPKSSKKCKSKSTEEKPLHKILVLNLAKLSPIIHIFDEMGIKDLSPHTETRPLWSLVHLDRELFEGLPITINLSPKLLDIQNQMLGLSPEVDEECSVPSVIQASLRKYQIDGIKWLGRLRKMHLNGVLADDMGLGKTLQAITILTQHMKENEGAKALVVCPTSLVYNWKEEFAKFNPSFKVLAVDGNPSTRKKLLADLSDYDIAVTSYTLLQKDIESYKSVSFDYAILDEAQHIKNRGTRNAQSVKAIKAAHRLVLTGTPIENSLDELWSLFDFLMPGLLGSYERFVDKYLRTSPASACSNNLEHLKKKVAPFILRRMKKDVLSDLPPISEIVYHCHLSEVQEELYRTYAASAREELSALVKKEGFESVHIHVLATLTRLKQICCHPAIFAKDKAESGDSAKYDMLLELLQSLIEGRHKTVIFSQYTRMLNIMRDDLLKLGIAFEYLDGSSKNRLSIVKKFNEDQNIPIFLVSLKAGGCGLNLVGADTVIHYDMWWNPAVESQATDRVHRFGQKKSVSSYKLIALNTIEEKILELHDRKKGLVTEMISKDEEMMSKLTWEEVLELLQT